MLPLLLRSADSVQQIFGVVAALMKMETALKIEEYVFAINAQTYYKVVFLP